jgi:Rap1a immunity proteins
MKKFVITGAFMTWAALFSPLPLYAQTYPSTTWVRECSTPKTVIGDNVISCMAYIHGLINALAIWQFISPETAIVCIPDGANFGDMRERILPQVRKEAHPETSASMLITKVLAQYYPCRAKAKKERQS